MPCASIRAPSAASRSRTSATVCCPVRPSGCPRSLACAEKPPVRSRFRSRPVRSTVALRLRVRRPRSRRAGPEPDPIGTPCRWDGPGPVVTPTDQRRGTSCPDVTCWQETARCRARQQQPPRLGVFGLDTPILDGGRLGEVDHRILVPACRSQSGFGHHRQDAVDAA